MATFAEYLETVADPDDRDALAHAWEVAAEAAPKAVEGHSYGLPALKLGPSPLFAVQAAKDHLTLYPFSPPVIEAVADQLDDFRRTKGSVKFSASHPLPDDVIQEIVRLRVKEVAG